MIITQFEKHSLKQIDKAHISNSDKIENFKEVLKPYHLDNRLDNYYSPKALFAQFGADPAFTGQLEPLKKYLNPTFLSSKHYFIVNSSDQIRPVSNLDVKNALHQTIKLLEHSDK